MGKDGEHQSEGPRDPLRVQKRVGVSFLVSTHFLGSLGLHLPCDLHPSCCCVAVQETCPLLNLQLAFLNFESLLDIFVTFFLCDSYGERRRRFRNVGLGDTEVLKGANGLLPMHATQALSPKADAVQGCICPVISSLCPHLQDTDYRHKLSTPVLLCM